MLSVTDLPAAFEPLSDCAAALPFKTYRGVPRCSEVAVGAVWRVEAGASDFYLGQVGHSRVLLGPTLDTSDDEATSLIRALEPVSVVEFAAADG